MAIAICFVQETARSNMKQLKRYPKKGYLGGVCHGLGEHTDLDPILWRTIALFLPGSLLIYIGLWLFVKK